MRSFLHLVSLEPFHSEFERLSLSEKEREELLKILEEIYLHKLTDKVLDELQEEEKVKFLKLMTLSAEIEMIEFLKERIENIEGKLQEEVKILTAELLIDIRGMK